MKKELYFYSVEGVKCITSLWTTWALWLNMICGRKRMQILMLPKLRWLDASGSISRRKLWREGHPLTLQNSIERRQRNISWFIDFRFVSFSGLFIQNTCHDQQTNSRLACSHGNSTINKQIFVLLLEFQSCLNFCHSCIHTY
ncbi:unnamed protein product [Musa textilis]